MKVNVLEETQGSITIEFEGMDRAVPELIKEKLLENKDVDFASVVKEHPQFGLPRLVVKSSKKPRPLISKALKEVEEDIKEFSSQFSKK